ncbi:hypothetical protein ACFVWN_20460 [Nocardiopsis flavescens]|uniref:hypothetical protein n=1 Tax=Nocardiopsis flavescens TaxID=758803 RepID=UPI0036525C9A
MTPRLMPDADAQWVMRNVHRGYHRGGANPHLPWSDPLHKSFKVCPCLWVCDDCTKGRCRTNPGACTEVWNADFRDWRLMPRPDTDLVRPSSHPTRSAGRICVWVNGCCGRYICSCTCWRPILDAEQQAGEQLALFEDPA